MSPRSEEFLAGADERLRGARAALAADAPGPAVSAAYYATLYGARAVLSELDRNAKTHTGTCALFAECFVASGRFDAELARAAGRLRDVRLRADYDALAIEAADAAEWVATAERFVAAVRELLD